MSIEVKVDMSISLCSAVVGTSNFTKPLQTTLQKHVLDVQHYESGKLLKLPEDAIQLYNILLKDTKTEKIIAQKVRKGEEQILTVW